jgi:hypothetical protein
MKNMKMLSGYIKMRVLSLLFTLILVGSCTSDFEEINTNPALVTADLVNVNNLLARVQKESVFDYYEYGYITEFAGYYSNPATVPLSNRNWTDPFNEFYRSFVINTSEIIRLTHDKPLLQNKNAIGRIMKVWIFQQLTDLYGDLPYFESALNVKDVVNYPRYDKQEDIYKDLLKELKEAEMQLSSDPQQVSFGASDLIFKGDVESWRRFANSLRLRLAIRVRFADPVLAKTHISEVIAKPMITLNAQNASLTTEGQAASNIDNRNPIFNRYAGTTVPLYVSNTVTETLLARSDPRLPIFVLPATEPEGGDLWRGRPLAMDSDLEGGDISFRQEQVASLGSIFHAAQYQIKIMTASEVSFLRAEAALAGMTTESAEEAWKEGIKASMQLYGVAADKADLYIAEQDKVFEVAGAEKKLEEIIVQKWIGNYFQSKESWAEYRRTGYPLIWVGKQKGDTGGKIPRRLTYPMEEYLRNEKSASEASARLQGGDTFMARVWWDAKPGLPLDHPKQDSFPIEKK